MNGITMKMNADELILLALREDITSEEEQKANSAIYDLSGRKVNNPTKGIYIINGKKVIY